VFLKIVGTIFQVAFFLDVKIHGPEQPKPGNRLWILMARKLAGKPHRITDRIRRVVQKIPNAHYVIEILTFWWQLSERSGKELAEQAVDDCCHS
jgi:hypothetical protein